MKYKTSKSASRDFISSKTLKVKSDEAVELPIYAFLIVFNSNI